MGGNAAHERRGELDDAVASKEQVNGLIAGEMTALEQDRHAVFFREFFSSNAHGGKIANRFAEQPGRFVEVGRDQGGERKQFCLVKLDRVGAQKLRAAGRDDHRIDHERNLPVDLAGKIDQRSRDRGNNFGGVKQPGLDRGDWEILEENCDLLVNHFRAHWLDAGNFSRDFRHNAGDGS